MNTVTNSPIYTPRASIDMLFATAASTRNKSVNTVVPYKGYDISISMDSSHGEGDLARSDMLVFAADGKDATFALFPELGRNQVLQANADNLKAAFAAIDKATNA